MGVAEAMRSDLRRDGGQKSVAGSARPSRLPKALWAVVAVVAWYLWIVVTGVVSGLLLGRVVAMGARPDSDLIFFAGLYAISALFLMLVGYVGHRLVGLMPLPFAPWKPGVFVVAATTLASISMRDQVVGQLLPSMPLGQLLLPYVLAPLAVLAGIAIAALQERAKS